MHTEKVHDLVPLNGYSCILRCCIYFSKLREKMSPFPHSQTADKISLLIPSGFTDPINGLTVFFLGKTLFRGRGSIIRLKKVISNCQ